MITRSRAKDYDKKRDYVICCKGPEVQELHACMTFQTSNLLYEVAKSDFNLLRRLSEGFDAMAGDILYHKCC